MLCQVVPLFPAILLVPTIDGKFQDKIKKITMKKITMKKIIMKKIIMKKSIFLYNNTYIYITNMKNYFSKRIYEAFTFKNVLSFLVIIITGIIIRCGFSFGESFVLSEHLPELLSFTLCILYRSITYILNINMSDKILEFAKILPKAFRHNYVKGLLMIIRHFITLSVVESINFYNAVRNDVDVYTVKKGVICKMDAGNTNNTPFIPSTDSRSSTDLSAITRHGPKYCINGKDIFMHEYSGNPFHAVGYKLRFIQYPEFPPQQIKYLNLDQSQITNVNPLKFSLALGKVREGFYYSLSQDNMEKIYLSYVNATGLMYTNNYKAKLDLISELCSVLNQVPGTILDADLEVRETIADIYRRYNRLLDNTFNMYDNLAFNAPKRHHDVKIFIITGDANSSYISQLNRILPEQAKSIIRTNAALLEQHCLDNGIMLSDAELYRKSFEA